MNSDEAREPVPVGELLDQLTAGGAPEWHSVSDLARMSMDAFAAQNDMSTDREQPVVSGDWPACPTHGTPLATATFPPSGPASSVPAWVCGDCWDERTRQEPK